MVLERYHGVMTLAMMEVAQELGGVALMEDVADEIEHELRQLGRITPISMCRLESIDPDRDSRLFDRFDTYFQLDAEVESGLD